jgi:hypothetical protein
LSRSLSSGHNVFVNTGRGLDLLLDLDGYICEMGDCYWVKIEARRVSPDAGRPHGIAYSLTLHSPAGERLIGYDNAHGARLDGFPDRIAIPFDHQHRRTRALPYEYSDAASLLEDFWADVEDILAKEGVQ